MRFYTQEDDIDRSHLVERTRNFRMGFEISFRAFYANPLPLHGHKVRATGEECDIEAGICHARTDIASDGTSARNQEFHPRLSRTAFATARRRIFPVPVVGMLSTKWIFFGHLYSAKWSRQCLISEDSVRLPGSCSTTAGQPPRQESGACSRM